MNVDGQKTIKWDIPGWGAEHWEDVYTALEREVGEEMWLKITHINPNPKYFSLVESAAKKIPLGIILYEAEVENLNYIPSEECQEIKFFTFEEALKANTFHAVRYMFEEMQARNILL